MIKESIDKIKELLSRKVQTLPPLGSGGISFDVNGKLISSTCVIHDDGKRLANPDGPKVIDILNTIVKEIKLTDAAWAEDPDRKLENGYYWIVRKSLDGKSEFFDIGKVDVDDRGIRISLFGLPDDFKVWSKDRESFWDISLDNIKTKISIPDHISKGRESTWSEEDD